MKEDKIIVAVDGPAGSGKSSVSREVAIDLGLKYIDSGAIYRAITWSILRNHDEVTIDIDFEAAIKDLVIKQEFNTNGVAKTYVNDVDVSIDIRDELISKNIGIVSDAVVIREFVNSLLRTWADEESIIMDGRDIGSVVFPDAEFKVYLDASVDERTRRRVKEYEEMGKNVDENSIKNQIIQRDEQDKSRTYGKLTLVEDAVYLDSSHLTKEEVINKIESIIRGNPMEQVMQESNETIDMHHVVNSTLDALEVGKIISGEVVTIDSEYVYINVGLKSDGRVPFEEFDEKPEVGEKIELMMSSKRLVDGMYQFSKREADLIKKWSTFMEWYEQGNEIIEGKIISSNKKGKIVLSMGITMFLPFSHAADLKQIEKSDEFKSFKIKNIDPKKRSALLSRKEYLDEELKTRWSEFVEKYKASDIIEGEVIKFVEFGAFIRVHGLDALLHRNDMSWKKVFKQRKLLKQGQVREFIILDINREEGKISLGLKQLVSDPWEKIEEKYAIGDSAKGEVVTIANYGAFVEFEEGVEGFVNNSELSWTKQNANVKDYLEKGIEYDFKILDVKKDDRKLVLGYKQLQDNPWDTIEERFPIGTVWKKKVKKIVKFGMFIELEEDIDGLVHISDISWDDIKDVNDLYKVGDEVEVKVLDIKKTELKISCGMKQLTKSPWQVISETYKPRTRVEGTISGITPFGIFVKLTEDLEGLVHVSEVSKKRIDDLEEYFKVDDKVSAVVLDVDVKKKRLSLSIKQHDMIAEKEELDKIMKNTSPSTVTLGDFVDLRLGDKKDGEN